MCSVDLHHDCRSLSLSGSCEDADAGEFSDSTSLFEPTNVCIENFQTNNGPKESLIFMFGMCGEG